MATYIPTDIFPIAAIRQAFKEATFNNVAAEIDALFGAGTWKDGSNTVIMGKSVLFKDGKYTLLDEAGKEAISFDSRLEVIKAVLIIDKMETDHKIQKAAPAPVVTPPVVAAAPAVVPPVVENKEVAKSDETPAPKPNYGVKKNDKGLEFEIEIPIHKMDGEKRLVGGVVYEPDTVDAQGDSASEEEIQKAAHNFMIDSKTVGIMHKEDAGPRAKIVESYITPNRMQVGSQFVKRGTWIMVVKILDDGLWDLVKNDKITGFSMGGRASDTPEETAPKL